MSVENSENSPHRTLNRPNKGLEMIPKSKIVLGIDVGTSGLRGCIVKQESSYDDRKIGPTEQRQEKELILYSASVTLESPIKNELNKSSTQNPKLWIDGINQLLCKLSEGFDLSRITNLILDATSSTVLLCNQQGEPLTEALMYNDLQAVEEAKQISQTPGYNPKSGANGTSSSLAKVLVLLKRLKLNKEIVIQSRSNTTIPHDPPIYICHQIDYLNCFLSGQINTTDENNALKIGYDSINQAWPDWVKKLLHSQNNQLTLPEVVKPGTNLGRLNAKITARYGFSESTSLHAGTTDSIAGFLASGADQIGDVVISLGSTLAIKVISDVPIFSSEFGIYSHRLKNNWLVGGASNSGGAILTEQYSMRQMAALIKAIQSSGLILSETEQMAYYPLTKVGERFPIADSNLQPKMPLKPTQKLNLQAPSIEHQRYFLGLIHGLIHVEQLAYEKLNALGCHLKCVYAVGGGVQNKLWMSLRAERLQNNHYSTLKLSYPMSWEAAFGVTRLIERDRSNYP
ncbi:FGGY-family carbohydrate kinase [Thiomicrorhabdus arctica]|uniref:FGGY-family carbohydrate kinase n=1 Tax=Thiomicrorhabdus arctica TaxID=131540 RepID=UPI00039DD0CD|nr:FGGY family carbohydrate kinase [Thiomicrorhabdus arctica]